MIIASAVLEHAADTRRMEFTIDNRQIASKEDVLLISYNSDYICHFTFDDEWEGKVKTARFSRGSKFVDVVLANDECVMPVQTSGYVTVGVFTDEITSTAVKVWVKSSIKDSGGDPVAPTPDVYAQLIALIESGMLSQVTAEAIENALGYTPASEQAVKDLAVELDGVDALIGSGVI